jgi:hypothetical protein
VDYREYLQSPEWELKRQLKLDQKNHLCELCGARAEQVHHLTYYRVGEEEMVDLQALCDLCHKYEHDLLDWRDKETVESQRWRFVEWQARGSPTQRWIRPPHIADPTQSMASQSRTFHMKLFHWAQRNSAP